MKSLIRRRVTLYELTDNLGNVRAIFKKAGSGIIALTGKTDYYPFGMPMPNRQVTDNNYRYAFQGQEKDPETNMEAFELRLWDGRLGRWLTVDPAGQYFSPYLGMGNNPISRIDPDGGSDGDPPTGLGTPGATAFDPSDNSLFLANENGAWESVAWQPGITLTSNYHSFASSVIDFIHQADNFTWEHFYIPRLTIAAELSIFGIRGGTTIWGDGSGEDTSGLHGITRDSNESTDFVAPNGGGAELPFWLNKPNYVYHVIRIGKGFAEADKEGYELREAIDNEDLINRVMVNFTIYPSEQKIDSTVENIIIKVHGAAKLRVEDSLAKVQNNRNSTKNAYLNGWKK